MSQFGHIFRRLSGNMLKFLLEQTFGGAQLGVELPGVAAGKPHKTLSPRCQCASMKTRPRAEAREAYVRDLPTQLGRTANVLVFCGCKVQEGHTHTNGLSRCPNGWHIVPTARQSSWLRRLSLFPELFVIVRRLPRRSLCKACPATAKWVSIGASLLTQSWVPAKRCWRQCMSVNAVWTAWLINAKLTFSEALE